MTPAWIKCSDELPEEEHPVLAYWTNGGDADPEMDVMTLERAGDGELMWWNEGEGSHSFDLVEWWMPLPEPPVPP